jgi:ribosome-associated protein
MIKKEETLLENTQKVEQIIEWIEEKNGQDTEAIDVKELTAVTDYFIITSGNSERQVKAIAEYLDEKASNPETSMKLLGIEGKKEGRWILLDFGDIVVHVFHHEEREFYNIERLWRDGTTIKG